MKHQFDKETRISVVESLVLSQINYCISIWGSTNQTQLQRVQKLQNFAARVADGSIGKFDHITPIILELKWLTIEKQYKFSLGCIVWKIMNEKYPNWLLTMTRVSDITEGRTRQANDIFIPRVNLDVGMRAIGVRGPKLYNELPFPLKNISTIQTFKSKLKAHLITHDI